ncbi:MAG: hypothetical protein H6R23_1807 [Proteobacteria bacterium]|nr:hypothetical protein [Pseudomonadota bacterium]
MLYGEKLGHCERPCRHQERRPGFPDAAPAVHDEYQPERYEQRQQRQLPARHLPDQKWIGVGDLAGDRDGNTQGAKRHRRGIGDQAQTGGIERIETQAHQQRGGDRHRRAESRRAFQEGTKAEANQYHLQTLVVCDG